MSPRVQDLPVLMNSNVSVGERSVEGDAQVRNYMPDGAYGGNENLETVLVRHGYSRPFWWPQRPRLLFSRVAHDRNVTITRAHDIDDYKQYWSLYIKHARGDDIPSRIWEKKINDTLMALAPYCGFGDGGGIDTIVYFLDTAAAEIFGPVRSYLQRKYHSEDHRAKKQSVVTTPTMFNNLAMVHRDEVPGGKEWVALVRDQNHHHCEPPHSVTRSLGAGDKLQYITAWTWAVMAGCLRLLDRHSDLFVETPDSLGEIPIFTPIFLGHSGEDWNRAILLWRWFSRRRNAMKYQTAGKKRPSGNNSTKLFSLNWYANVASVRKELEDSPEHRAEAEFQILAMKFRPLLQTSGLDDAFRIREYDSYRRLDKVRRREFAFLHVTAVEQYRVQLCCGNKSTRRVDGLPHMSAEQQEVLCGLLRQRVEKVGLPISLFVPSRTLCDVLHGFREGRLLIGYVFHQMESGAGPAGSKWTVEERDRMENAIAYANDNEPDLFREDDGDKADGEESLLGRTGIYVPRDDEFLDDVEVMEKNASRGADRRCSDYTNKLDQTFGGNDTNDMTIQEAEKITGWTLRDPRVNPANSDSLKLMPHQIVDIAQIVRKLSVHPNTALLASACGIGKTNISLASIVQINRRNLAIYEKQLSEGVEENRRVRFKPSLILCPSSLVMDTYNEAARGFSDDLIPRIYYGSASNLHGHSAAQQAVVSRDDFPSVVRALREDDTQSAKHVFISSYFTFLRRSMNFTAKTRSQLNEQDRVLLGFNIMDNPTSKDKVPVLVEPDALGRGCLTTTDAGVPADVTLDEDEFHVRCQLDREEADDEEPVPEDEGGKVDRDDPIDSLGKRKRFRETYKILSPAYEKVFNVVVLDEAHLVKNRMSTLHRMAKVIRRDYLLLSTATPMLNNPTDVLSYALLAWPTAKPYPLPSNFSFNSFYGPGAAWLDYKPHEDPRERYFKNAKGLDSELARALSARRGQVLERYVARESRTSQSYQPLVKRDEFSDDQYEEIVRTGSRPWILNPVHFYWACREFNAKGSFDACRKVVRDMLSAFIVKRGMQTRLPLPDGSYVTPSDGLLGACFRIVNVRFKPQQQAEYDALYEKWKTSMYYTSGDRVTASDGLGFERRGSRPASARRMNPAAFRHLLLPAFNLNNWKLLEPREDTAALASALGVGVDRSASRTQSKFCHLSEPANRTSRPVAMGTEESRTLAVDTEDGGAQWLFESLKAGPEYMMPGNRFGFVYWLAYHSPIMSQLVVQVRDWIKQPRQYGLPNRVVVMAAMPWVQQ
ncbi:hypothetical protein F4776DRAFT_677116 [Hypoxylon sp. NC0597]|nr:hypothetical protein F4776DRAFT_677116 [Hypoxylon sp. NC0597]